MGTTFFNIQVSATDPAPVSAVLREIGALPCYVAKEATNAWVAVFPGDGIDPEELAQTLSLYLDTATLFFCEFDSDTCNYTLFDRSVIWDAFDSDPDFWAGESGEDGEPILPKTPEELAALQGNLDTLLPFCIQGTTVAQIRAALDSTHAEANARHFGRDAPQEGAYNARRDADAIVFALIKLLGLNESLATHSYYGFASRAEHNFDADLLYSVEHLPITQRPPTKKL